MDAQVTVKGTVKDENGTIVAFASAALINATDSTLCLLYTSKSLPSSYNSVPFVTVQLPVYNEKYVVERLIDNIVLLNYPKDKFEIHVLDDSTDDTRVITQRKVDEYQNKGFNIKLITLSLIHI